MSEYSKCRLKVYIDEFKQQHHVLTMSPFLLKLQNC